MMTCCLFFFVCCFATTFMCALAGFIRPGGRPFAVLIGLGLHERGLGELHVVIGVLRVEDRLDLAEAVAGGRDPRSSSVPLAESARHVRASCAQ
jgi:hypothetical protein